MKLSICIPTYNRGNFLPDLFESIIKQFCDIEEESIEIVVSDNASTDNTTEVINRYKNKFKNFVYFRWEKNMGADRNFLKVVDLSSGEYCWLMGSDDIMLDGGLRKVINFIKLNPKITGLSVNRHAYSFDLKKIIRERPVLKKVTQDIIFKDLSVLCLFDYWGYLSGQIIRKQLWDNILFEEHGNIENYFNAYVHVYVITKMVLKNTHWGFISGPCVGWRSGNDSFLTDLGYYKRLKLDVTGYEKILKDIFGKKSKIYKQLNQKILKVHVKYGLLGIKLNQPSLKVNLNTFKLLYDYYKGYPFFWFFNVPLLLTPSFLLKILRMIYRKTLKKWLHN